MEGKKQLTPEKLKQIEEIKQELRELKERNKQAIVELESLIKGRAMKMIELNLTYEQALTLLDFLSIRIEAVGENEPEILEMRENLISALDDYEQECSLSIGIQNHRELLKQLPKGE